MRSFEYIKPTTVAEATRFLHDHADGSFVVGGGSAAVVMLQLGIVRPQYVVDIGSLSGLQDLSPNGDLHIGALVRIRSLELEVGVRNEWGLLAEACSQVANVRVRNVATVGGAVAYGEPQTDTPTALMAMRASVEIAGASGSRVVPIDEFYLAPYETVLRQGELVVGIHVPRPAAGSGGSHEKFTVGSPENKPVANASALVALDDATGKCTAARVVMGATSPTPVVGRASEGLLGEVLTEARISEVAAAAAEEIDPIEDLRGPVWYKRRITTVLVRRALTCALQRAQK